MERNDKSIQEIIEKIVTLLQANDEKVWANYLKQLSFEYENLDKREKAIKKILKIYEGGMGSFSDLVLQRNYKMLVNENNQLAILKHELYNACLGYCSNNKIN